MGRNKKPNKIWDAKKRAEYNREYKRKYFNYKRITLSNDEWLMAIDIGYNKKTGTISFMDKIGYVREREARRDRLNETDRILIARKPDIEQDSNSLTNDFIIQQIMLSMENKMKNKKEKENIVLICDSCKNIDERCHLCWNGNEYVKEKLIW